MRETAPWPVMIVAGLIIVAAMAVFGALWSGTEAGQAFAEAATSSYEGGWLRAIGVGRDRHEADHDLHADAKAADDEQDDAHDTPHRRHPPWHISYHGPARRA